MDLIKIDNLNGMIKSHNQFKRSQLWTDISVACECTSAEASEFAKTHCNMLSFYAILRAAKKYSGQYREFLKYCLENKYCDKKGYISADKDVILDSLDIKDYTLVKFRDFKFVKNPESLNAEKFYQMKIKANTEGFHFMACYIYMDELYLSDSSFRGVGVKALDFINSKNFVWLMEVV